MAQMCLVKDAMFPEGWAGTLRTPLRPSGGLMSSLLLTGFMGELSWGGESRGVQGARASIPPTSSTVSKVLTYPHFTERETEAQRGALPATGHTAQEGQGPAPLSGGWAAGGCCALSAPPSHGLPWPTPGLGGGSPPGPAHAPCS